MAGDEILIEGVAYIPSRKAAEECGYTQDYVGQLCRKGLITAKRMGGLWYIQLDSLKNYKKTADSYVPVAPRRDVSQGEVEIDFEGKKYVTASLAAEKIGYHPDYIGQLARSGAIPARRIGDRWFVESESLKNHKKEKDSLLAEVQTVATGVREDKDVYVNSVSRIQNLPHFTYHKEKDEPLPVLKRNLEPEEDTIPNPVPIRTYSSTKTYFLKESRVNDFHNIGARKTNDNTSRLLTTACVFLVIVLCAYISASAHVSGVLEEILSFEVLYRSSSFSL
jgi:sarcosine oxidase gamma subunit